MIRALKRDSVAFVNRLRWEFRLLTAGFRALPTYLILGAEKAGTFTLFEVLGQHPDCGKNFSLAGSWGRKETQFFTKNYEKGERWYRAHFPYRGVCGEATPFYLFHPGAPERAHAMLPEARLIVLLRNPVDRAYSAYHHNVRSGREPLPTFEEAIAAESERVQPYLDEMLDERSSGAPAVQHYAYCARGLYFEQLERWERWYPREQFLLLEFETLYADFATHLRTVLDFIGLRPWAPTSVARFNEGSYLPMSPETRLPLERYFEPHNQRLFEHLGRELWRVEPMSPPKPGPGSGM